MPTNVLVSGAPERIAAASEALRAHDCTVVEVDDLADVPAACAAAGDGAFDAYLQLPAAFSIEGSSAIERLYHFYVHGVLARFPAMNAAVPALKPGGRIIMVAWQLPAEVDTDDDIEARRALYRVLANGAQADAGDGVVVRVLGSSTSTDDIALVTLGKESLRPAAVESLSGVSYADWRVELLGLVSVES
jgi:threonine dehydrogenase-like Zn-dependent dehydrogenase